MPDAETRALGRAAALLLLASVARWGWGAAHRTGGVLQGPDQTAELLEESRAMAADQEERDRPLGPSERLDPNRASAAELDRLPGVGPATARAIVASRERDGPFRRLEDLDRVKGVGKGTLERVEKKLDFSNSPPVTLRAQSRVSQMGESPGSVPRRVDLNRASAEELETLPGVGPALAGRILDARRQRPFASVDDLLRVRGIGPATVERLRARVAVAR